MAHPYDRILLSNKKEQASICVTTWRYLKSILLSERNRSQNITYCSIFIKLSKKRKLWSGKNKSVAEQAIKQDPSIYCLQETHFRSKDTYRLKVREWEVRGWKNVFHSNGNKKKAGVAYKRLNRH